MYRRDDIVEDDIENPELLGDASPFECFKSTPRDNRPGLSSGEEFETPHCLLP
jgi:hypothetical protein